MNNKKIIIPALVGQVVLIALYILNPNLAKTKKVLQDCGKFMKSSKLSSQDVTSFGQDGSRTVWIGTSDGLNLYDGSTFIQLFHDEMDSTSLPSNKINCINRDGLGNMWVGTSNGVAKYTGAYHFRKYNIPYSSYGILQIENAPDSAVLVNNGVGVYKIKNEEIKKIISFRKRQIFNYIYSDGSKGYWHIDPNVIEHVDQYNNITYKEKSSNANIGYVYRRNDSLLISQGQRITWLNLKTGEILFRKDKLSILPTTLFFDNDKNVLVNSGYHGLYNLDTSTGNLTKIGADKLHLLHQDVTISSAFEDEEHNCWIGFQNGGFQIVSHGQKNDESPLEMATQGMNVSCIAKVGHSILGGIETGMFCFDEENNSMRIYKYYDMFNDSPVYRQVLNAIVPYGDNGRAWLITHVRIFSAEVNGGHVNIIKRAFGNDNLGPQLGTGIRLGDKVVVTSNSPYLISCAFGSSRPDSVKVGNLHYDENAKLLKMADGKVLIVMRGMQMAVYDPHNNKVSPYSYAQSDSLLNLSPSTVFKDSRNRIWIGTPRNGLYQLSYHGHKLWRDNYVPIHAIKSINESKNGELWISSPSGIVEYQPDTRSAFFSSYMVNQLRDAELPVLITESADGGNSIVYGSTNGCFQIAKNLKENTEKTSLRITGIKIGQGNEEYGAINRSITNGDHYTFDSDNNDLYISFNTANYGNRRRLLYQTKLEGYSSWSAPSLSSHVHYLDLEPGDYTFRVRTILSPTLPPLDEMEVRITIRPAFWQSMAAIYFYIMCALGVLFYINHLYLRSRTDMLRIKQMREEKARDKQTNEMNMSFFANVSHEFRNPLTIIAGPLMVLRDDKSLSPAVHHTINMVCKSVNRMLRLIDQMLDFNQLETDALRLHVSQYDIACELSQIVSVFGESAKLRGIKVETKGLAENVFGWMDKDKLEKIMSNLLTNALKHTPDNGIVRVCLSEHKKSTDAELAHGLPENTDRFIRVSVFNNGNHIDEDKLPYVFMRYYQSHKTGAKHQYGWGTGIGLYYVKRQVTLHHGNIDVCNEQEGGVSFSFMFPIDENIYRDAEHVSKDDGIMQIPIEEDADVDRKIEENTNQVNAIAKKPVMLIVDDDTAVAQYIRSVFSDEYVVVNRFSAESAYADIDHIKPNIILSDVVMDEMDGYDFCRKLKDNSRYSHIPIVLITAKSNIDEQIEGLDTGASAYVTKPFDPRYLKALVKNLINRSQYVQKLLTEGRSDDKPVEGLSEQDRKFMEELYKLMEKHLKDQDLNISTISQELLISHTKFNYKLKELTGETPGSFFRKFKLNRAARLLREGKHNVSEVAIETGFGTVSYFSVAFKKQFGVSPSEYK